MSPQLAALIDAARDLAWQQHGNLVGLAYHERRESFARLRGTLAAATKVRAGNAGILQP